MRKSVLLGILGLIVMGAIMFMTLSPRYVDKPDEKIQGDIEQVSAPPHAPPVYATPVPRESPEPPPEETPELAEEAHAEPRETPEQAVQATPEPLPNRGYAEAIPETVQNKMAGISMPEGATVKYEDLSYLTVYYIDFEGQHRAGNMVVANELAEEVLDIFADLYDIKYPIETIGLIDDYNDKQTDELDTLDRASMGNNNTSAFCYRAMNSAGTLSQHAFGRAVDLNPKINPYVSGSTVSPANAKQYADRSGDGLSEVEARAIIRKDDEVYKIFTSRGWKWGCEIWSGVNDYQHFQKEA